MADKTIFDHTSDSNVAGDEYVAMETIYGFTAGKTYTLAPAPCSCCTWAFYGDNGSAFTHVDGLPTLEKVEDNVAAFPAPVGVPLSFGEMPDDQRGMLLLDKFEGKIMQFYSMDAREWKDRYGDNIDGDFFYGVAYRTKPQELIDAENELAAAEARKSELKDEIERLAANL